MNRELTPGEALLMHQLGLSPEQLRAPPEPEPELSRRQWLENLLAGYSAERQLPPAGGGNLAAQVNSLVDMFNPVAGLEEAGSQTRTVFNPDRSTGDRVQAGIGALLNTALAATPLFAAKMARRPMTTAAGNFTDDAIDVVADVARGVGHTPTPETELELDPLTWELLQDDDLAGFGLLPNQVAASQAQAVRNWTELPPDRLPASYDEIPGHPAAVIMGGDLPDRGAVGPVSESLRETGPFYSRLDRAVDALDQPFYSNLEEVRKKLTKEGVKEFELDRVPWGFLEEVQRAEGHTKVPRSFLQKHLQGGDIDAASLGDKTRSGLQPRFSEYAVPGSWDQRETVLQDPYFPYEGVGVRRVEGHWGQGPSMVPEADEASGVFVADPLINPSESGVPGASEGLPVAHVRSGSRFTADGQITHHVDEIQSDVAQELRRMTGLADMADRLLGDSDLMGILEEAVSGAPELSQSGFFNPRFDNVVRSPEVWAERVVSRDPEALEPLKPLLTDMGYDLLAPGTDTSDPMATLVDYANILQKVVRSQDFAGNARQSHAGTTSRWTELAVRKALVEALENPDARMFSWNSGVLANAASGQEDKTLRGMKGFYDDVLPKRVKSVLRDLEKRSGLEMPKVQTLSLEKPDVPPPQGRKRPADFSVQGFPITKNLRRAIQEYGFPLFALPAGIVAGSTLSEIDVFGDQEGPS